MNIFHQFYVRIEQIQGIYYKIDESNDEIKRDLPPCPDASDSNINYDESQSPEISAEDGFDDISVDNYIDGTLMTKDKRKKLCAVFHKLISTFLQTWTIQKKLGHRKSKWKKLSQRNPKRMDPSERINRSKLKRNRFGKE